jgi:hypothetical protein
MGSKLNEIRRKISRLRADMLVLQQHIRVQVNHDLDCSESSVRLMAMRTQMVDLIGRRNALGGIEACPDGAAQLRQPYRPELRRRNLVPKEKPGRSRALAM